MLPKYREEIYTCIEREYDCSWYYDNVDTNIKAMNISQLNDTHVLSVCKIGSFYWTKGLLQLLSNNNTHFILGGATRNLSLYFFLVLKKLFYKKKQVILWTHGYYGKEKWFELFFFKRPLLKLADKILVYGNYSKKLMVNDGFDSNKIYTIHNSLAYSKQIELRQNVKTTSIYSEHFGNSNPVLIFLGRLTPVKKLDMILDAMTILKDKGEFYNMVFVGDGSEMDMLADLALTRGMSDRVWFFGACYDEVTNAELVYNADLCVSPGNIGLTAMHVLMFGCPIITHDDFKWQMPEFESVIPGETGLFFERDNVVSLATNISKWFKDKKGKRELVRLSCYKEVDSSWNPTFQMNVINDIISPAL